ncbi:MAG: thioredoxin family protein [Deltaproteobacteria bacterium]|nr:thioredoxin family protein [Deltaproteobacteria bacterium]
MATKTEKRKVEVFSAGCPCCEQALDLVNSIACSSCEVTVADMKDPETQKKAAKLGVKSVPEVVIDGKIASCCLTDEISEKALRNEGIGKEIKK